MSCQSCGCAPCQCNNPSYLNQPNIIDPTVSGGTFANPVVSSPTITDGQISGTQEIGVSIDSTSVGFTQPEGTCNATIATTAYTCNAITDAISALNPAFCAAVNTCTLTGGSVCSAVAACISLSSNIINNTNVFGPGAQATTTTFGVVRYATLTEIRNADCGVSIEPCQLAAFLSAPSGPMSTALCSAVFFCGAAPLASPVFTGNPLAPTPLPGDNDTSIATTAFVQAAIAAAIAAAVNGGNPAFCAAVSACGGGGSGMGVVARGRINTAWQEQLNVAANSGVWIGSVNISGTSFGVGCVLSTSSPTVVVNVTFTVPLPNTSYSVLFGSESNAASPFGSVVSPVVINKTVSGFDLIAEAINVSLVGDGFSAWNLNVFSNYDLDFAVVI